MSGHTHTATVRWSRDGAPLAGHRYSRKHRWTFDGGIEVPASASPLVVREPFSDPHAVDPEEAFAASVAGCHMLFFLDHAARAGFAVETYADTAVATMATGDDGREWVATIDLRPQITWAGEPIPSSDQIAALHERSHHDCYIANSVKTDVRVLCGVTSSDSR